MTAFKEGELVLRLGVKREPGWLYYLDRTGNVVRTPTRRDAQRRRLDGSSQELVVTTNLARDDDTWLYYLDRSGDIRALKKPGPAGKTTTDDNPVPRNPASAWARVARAHARGTGTRLTPELVDELMSDDAFALLARADAGIEEP